MQKSDFYFELPGELIAQEPCMPRDAARLLCLARTSGAMEHRVFHELPELLRPGDLLVINDSKVLPARLIGRKEGGGAVSELLLLRQVHGDVWECLARPGKRLHKGTHIEFGDGTLTAVIREILPDGNRYAEFFYDTQTLYEKLDAFGRMPLPPYIQKQLEDASQYQTVYARALGSAAAPTAGLHFTPELMGTLRARGIGFAEVQYRREDRAAHSADQSGRQPGDRRRHYQLPHTGIRCDKIRRDTRMQRRYGYFHLSGLSVQGHRRPHHEFSFAGKHAHYAGIRLLRLREYNARIPRGRGPAVPLFQLRGCDADPVSKKM